MLAAGDVHLFADVDVKHSAALAARPLADEVDDTVHRGAGRRPDRQRGRHRQADRPGQGAGGEGGRRPGADLPRQRG